MFAFHIVGVDPNCTSGGWFRFACLLPHADANEDANEDANDSGKNHSKKDEHNRLHGGLEWRHGLEVCTSRLTALELITDLH